MTTNKDDDFSDLSFDKDYDDVDSFSVDKDWKHQDMSFDTFKLRNDPGVLLDEIKFYLMQVEEVVDEKNPSKVNLKRRSNPFTKELVDPIVNQQGVEEIMMTLKPLINNHNVMGNTSNEAYHKQRMNFISGDFLVNFWSKRDKWGLKRDNVNPLIYFLSHQIDLFLSRTIGDLERSHYGESFKETREVKPMVQEKKNFLSNLVPGAFRR